MVFRIKNWEKFQHYKTRKPPWIKLYRDLLDDMQWFCLQGASKGLLIELWILASEMDGVLPPIDEIAFRVRKSSKELNSLLSTLSHWLEQDASNMLADCKQVATLETERETETDIYSFSEIWGKYPNKDGRKEAERHFKASVLTPEDWANINKALTNYISHLRKETWKQPKNGSTWFNNWKDWIDFVEPNSKDLLPPDPQKVKQSDDNYKRIIEREEKRVLNKVAIA